MTLNPFPNEARWSVVSLIEKKRKEAMYFLFVKVIMFEVLRTHA